MDEPYIPYETIIAVASITSIIVFSLFLLAMYAFIRLIRNVVSKLKRLESKEKAEKLVESKLLEKRVVLMGDGEEDIPTDISASCEMQPPSNFHTEQSPLLAVNQGHNERDQASSQTTSGGNSTKRSVSSHRQKTQEYSQWVIPIDEIDILKRLADGANGTVYLASWNGTKVALKSLKQRDESMDSANDDDEFEREASLLGSIRHPNIVQFLVSFLREVTSIWLWNMWREEVLID